MATLQKKPKGHKLTQHTGNLKRFFRDISIPLLISNGEVVLGKNTQTKNEETPTNFIAISNVYKTWFDAENCKWSSVGIGACISDPYAEKNILRGLMIESLMEDCADIFKKLDSKRSVNIFCLSIGFNYEETLSFYTKGKMLDYYLNNFPEFLPREEIAEIFDLSKQRISQIIEKVKFGLQREVRKKGYFDTAYDLREYLGLI